MTDQKELERLKKLLEELDAIDDVFFWKQILEKKDDGFAEAITKYENLIKENGADEEDKQAIRDIIKDLEAKLYRHSVASKEFFEKNYPLEYIGDCLKITSLEVTEYVIQNVHGKYVAFILFPFHIENIKENAKVGFREWKGTYPSESKLLSPHETIVVYRAMPILIADTEAKAQEHVKEAIRKLFEEKEDFYDLYMIFIDFESVNLIIAPLEGNEVSESFNVRGKTK